jgi:hypothetical protein
MLLGGVEYLDEKPVDNPPEKKPDKEKDKDRKIGF